MTIQCIPDYVFGAMTHDATPPKNIYVWAEFSAFMGFTFGALRMNDNGQWVDRRGRIVEGHKVVQWDDSLPPETRNTHFAPRVEG